MFLSFVVYLKFIYSFIDKKGNKLPYLDKYVVYIVGDLNNQVLKFEGGELDILPVTVTV